MDKVLVVDDRADIRDLMEAVLKIKGYKILKGESGGEAIEIAKKERPGLIIMDIMMPGDINGLEACSIIKEDPEIGDSKIIMVSGKGRESDRQACFKAGADDYFLKPFRPFELLKKVEDLLE